MSDEHREITQGDIGSDEGNSSEQIAELETVDFVWEDYLEEIGRFENRTGRVVLILSVSGYIMARRLPNKVSIIIGPVPNIPKLDSDAKSIVDV